MKAAIIDQQSGVPQYRDYPDPVTSHPGELMLTMRAAALKHVDRSRAAGTHYSTQGNIDQAQVIGGDGVGVLANGRRVYAVADGMIAEKVVIDKGRMVPVPKELDDVTAAALPNAVIGSAMALRFRARLKKGETVLINGATGFTGKMAVQVARYLGAKWIIVTGRNEHSLRSLLTLGAHETISLNEGDNEFTKQLKQIHGRTPIDIVIDYLWGHSAELILSAFKGDGIFTHKTRFVSIGSVTGDLIQLSAENLRSVDLQLSGSGIGSWTRKEIKELLGDILPTAFKLAAQKKLVVDTVTVSLKDIETVWETDIPDGARLVVTL